MYRLLTILISFLFTAHAMRASVAIPYVFVKNYTVDDYKASCQNWGFSLTPDGMLYLARFRDLLETRKGFAGWERAIQERYFYALLRVGPYTFSRYKVAWRYIARSFITAVIAPMQDPYLGETLPLPNEKVVYVGTDCREEAYYLCGILSSAPVRCCVTCYMNPTSISAHVKPLCARGRNDQRFGKFRFPAGASAAYQSQHRITPSVFVRKQKFVELLIASTTPQNINKTIRQQSDKLSLCCFGQVSLRRTPKNSYLYQRLISFHLNI